MFAKRLGGGQSWENLLTQTKYSVAVLSKLKLTHHFDQHSESEYKVYQNLYYEIDSENRDIEAPVPSFMNFKSLRFQPPWLENLTTRPPQAIRPSCPSFPCFGSR